MFNVRFIGLLAILHFFCATMPMLCPKSFSIFWAASARSASETMF